MIAGRPQATRLDRLTTHRAQGLPSTTYPQETAFCNTELAETNAKKENKEAEIQKLSTQIDQMSARTAQLKEEVAALQKALAELDSSQAQMNKIRAEEKEAFATNKADMEQGIQGVKMALKILTEYYAKEGKALCMFSCRWSGREGQQAGSLLSAASDFLPRTPRMRKPRRSETRITGAHAASRAPQSKWNSLLS